MVSCDVQNALDTKLPYVKGGRIMSYVKAGKMMARESEGWQYVIQAQDNILLYYYIII